MGKKHFIVSLLLIGLLVTNIFGFATRESWAATKATTKKYQVKEQYIRDIAKKFKVIKKKYGWTLKNGSFSHAAQCDYQIPGKEIWYTFQGGDDFGSWKMKNDSRCIFIRMKVKTLVKGFKGKIRIKKFVAKLYSRKKKAKWNMGVTAYVWGEEAACITFYAKSGQKYRLEIPMDSGGEHWISANDWVQVIKIKD